MDGKKRSNKLELVGYHLGRALRKIGLLEKSCIRLLTAIGLPVLVVQFSKWTVRVSLIVLFSVYCVYLLVPIFFVIVACVARLGLKDQGASLTMHSVEQPEWRHGKDGYGYYDAFGLRSTSMDSDKH